MNDEILDNSVEIKYNDMNFGQFIGYSIFGYLSIQIVKDFCSSFTKDLLFLYEIEFSTIFYIEKILEIMILVAGIFIIRYISIKYVQYFKKVFLWSVVLLFVLNILQLFYYTTVYQQFSTQKFQHLNEYSNFVVINYSDYTAAIYIIEYLLIAIILLLGKRTHKSILTQL